MNRVRAEAAGYSVRPVRLSADQHRRPEGVKKRVGTIAEIVATPSASEIAISVGEEIGYDDGEADGTYHGDTAGCGVAVHFTSPDQNTLKTARFYLETNESAA